MAQSAAEQYRKALEAAEAIKQNAVDELKTAITKQIDELNGFGFAYRLTEGGKATRKRAPSDKVKHCEICNLDGHDARNHRNQDPKKKFTQKELSEKGLPNA